MAHLYFGIPFAGLIVFFGLYMGVVNNQNLDRGVRFNALQAILLDIILMCASDPMFCDVASIAMRGDAVRH